MTGTGIGEFFVSIGVDAAEGALTVSNLVSSFGQLEIATIAEIGVLWELGVRLAAITDAGIQAALGFEQFSMHTGISAQALQHWQVVAEQSHASAQDVTTSMESVQKGLRMIGLGQDTPLLKALQFLGISAKDAFGNLKNADTVMTEIRHRLGVVTQDAATQELVLGWAGVNANMRETLLLSDDLYNKRAALVPGMSKAQEDRLDAMRQAFVEIELQSKQIGVNIAAWMAPAVTASIKMLEDAVGGLRALLARESAKNIYGEKPTPFLQALTSDKHGDLKETLFYKWFFSTPEERAGASGGLAAPAMPAFAGTGGVVVNVDKHDVIHVNEAHNPQKTLKAVQDNWDELMKRSLDAFDQQNSVEAQP